MASKRFGGPYSPSGHSPEKGAPPPPANQFRDRRIARPNIAGRLLWIPAALMLIAALRETGSNASAMVLELAAFAAFALSAWLTNEGLKAEEAYEERKVARPPTIPRKAFGAVLAGLGVAAGYTSGSYDLLSALVFGVVAGGAHIIGFGLDPMRKKGLEGVSDFDTDRVARAVDKAEDLVRATIDASKRIGDRGLEARIERLATSARAMFRTVEEDPRDLPRARKFMTVYLMGARDATVKFADLYSRDRDPEARASYEALLGDLEKSFDDHRESLLIDNRSDLDVEIEVLRERLQTEGLRTE